MKKKLHLIFNPHSGKGKFKHTLPSIINNLKPYFDLDVNVSPSREKTRQIAKEISTSKHNPIIAAAGGDGLINEIINGADYKNIVLGIIPIGTANILAKELNIPHNIKNACLCIKDGYQKLIDVNTINNTRFVFSAGIGFDAQIIKSIKLHNKLIFGKLIYIWKFLHLFSKIQSFNTTLKIDGQQVFEGDIFNLIIGKSRYYGGKIVLFPKAGVDNGFLEIAVFTHPTSRKFFEGCVKFLFNKKDPYRKHWRAKEIQVITDQAVPIHVDGDDGSVTPAKISSDQKQLKVILPS